MTDNHESQSHMPQRMQTKYINIVDKEWFSLWRIEGVIIIIQGQSVATKRCKNYIEKSQATVTFVGHLTDCQKQ